MQLVASKSGSDLTFRDVHVQSNAVPQWDRRFEQVSDGPFGGTMAYRFEPGIQVFRESFNRRVHQSTYAWRGSRSFLLVRAKGRVVYHGLQVRDGAILTWSGEDELDLVTPDDFACDVITISQDALLARASRSGFDPARFPRWGVLDLPIALQDRFARTVAGYLAGAADPALDDLVALLDAVLREGVVETFPARCFERKRAVARARAISLGSLADDRTVSIDALCRELNVSRRTLQYYTQDVIGTNPLDYLRSVRLNAVRMELIDNESGGERICDVAARWGFSHPSQFARNYNALFGERPSDTVSRLVSERRERHWPAAGNREAA